MVRVFNCLKCMAFHLIPEIAKKGHSSMVLAAEHVGSNGTPTKLCVKVKSLYLIKHCAMKTWREWLF
jgi:hypothetical protein